MTDNRRIRPLIAYMETVPDPRCSRAKKHVLAEILTYLVAGYVTGHDTFRSCIAWCCRHLKWLRKGMKLKNGVASIATISRMLSQIDEELFLFAFMEWIGEMLKTRGLHISIVGKAVKAALSKVKGGRTPMLLNAIETASGLVLAQLPVENKDCEITKIPELLKLLDIRGSIITTDAIGTQTSIMQTIIAQGGHFVMMVKGNQPTAYDELKALFQEVNRDAEISAAGKTGFLHYDLLGKVDVFRRKEKNRDRIETRIYQVCHVPAYVTKTHKEWPFVKTIGLCKQLRILRISDDNGNDITPSESEFLKSGTRRQPKPATGDSESSDFQIVGLVSDLKLSAEQIGKYKRSHWRIENSLHHVLDVSLGEDRSPAKKSKNNLALIRKFAYNILRLSTLQQNIKLPITDLMFYFSDTLDLLGKYIFDGIEALN